MLISYALKGYLRVTLKVLYKDISTFLSFFRVFSKDFIKVEEKK